MTWAQIKVMSDAGMEIMSHTISHVDLGTSDDAAVVDQLQTSKANLEERTGKPVDFFVYPAGEPFRSGTEERQGQVVHVLARRLIDLSSLLSGYEVASRDFH